MTDFINNEVPVIDADANGNYPWIRIRAGGGISSFSEIKMAGPIYDQYGNLILGGGTGSINYVDLTFNPDAANPNPPIYNDWNILYSAIQSNQNKELITRLWFDDRIITNYDTSWYMGF